jgi:hypothetical protein
MAPSKRDASGSLRLKTFERDLRTAIRSDNGRSAKRLLHSLDMSNLMVDALPEKQFKLLCSVMRSRSFRRSIKAAGYVLNFFRRDQWENLSSNQKSRLLAELEWLYPKITAPAWYLCFIITVLLGECFRDERALNALLRLARVSRENSRSLIPHGLEHIVRDSGDPALAEIAMKRLLEMAGDPSAQVRDEVALSMARIENDKKAEATGH